MSIINNRENNTTTDSETGAYVSRISARPNEQLHFFKVVCGEEVFEIDTKRKLSSDKSTKIYEVTHTRPSFENGKSEFYQNIIRKLLVGYQEYHGKISGKELSFEVEFNIPNSLILKD